MRIKKIWTKIKDSLIRPVQDKKNTNRGNVTNFV